MENTNWPLVMLARTGDTTAFWRLVEPHLCCLLAIARANIANFDDAEDVVQETLLKALRNIRQFRGEAKFSTWLIQIAINEARYRHRKQASCEHIVLDELQDWRIPRDLQEWREIPSTLLERKQVLETLMRSLASLPSKHRDVFTLRDIVGLTTEESARILGITVANAKVRLLRARLHLRGLLAERLGIFCSERNAPDAAHQTDRVACS